MMECISQTFVVSLTSKSWYLKTQYCLLDNKDFFNTLEGFQSSLEEVLLFFIVKPIRNLIKNNKQITSNENYK